MSVAETALLAVSVLVVATGLAGMVAVLLSSLNERRREMAILRSVGARPVHVFALLMAEAGLLASAGVAAGLVLMHASLWAAQGLIESKLGLFVPVTVPAGSQWLLLGGIVAVGFLVGMIPAWRAYRYSLADGMTLRT